MGDEPVADGPRAALDVRGPERVESAREAIEVKLAPELVSCDPRDRLDGAEDVLSPCLAQERPVRPPQERDRDATAREDVFSEPTQIVKGKGRSGPCGGEPSEQNP